MGALANELNRIVRPRGHVFYGWYIVAASAGVQLLAGVLWMQSYGAYMVLLQEDFGRLMTDAVNLLLGRDPDPERGSAKAS